MRSFDAPQRRRAPTSFSALTLRGGAVSHTFVGKTLIVAIKTMCDGCRDFVNAPLDELEGVSVLIVSATNDESGEWTTARHEILVAPELLVELGVRWPPFYVVIDATAGEVITEGVVFGPSQVAQEIAPYVA